MRSKNWVTIALIFYTTTWANDQNIPMVVGPCITCHGAGGSSVGPATPTIAGREKECFIEIMEGYRDNERLSTVMGRLAKGYTDADFKIMADYFYEQPIVHYPQNVDSAKVEKGRKLHNKYCETCHENEECEESEGYNLFAGQRMPYLQYSLADFLSGNRDMPKKMEKYLLKMIKEQGKESLDDLVHFYGSQKSVK
jgi:sulfide dehydrogenase cytochrome subunit